MTSTASNTIQVGGLAVERTRAVALATDYLAQGRHGSAYPSYDTYDLEHALGPLTDADLLAPVLLNVQHLSISTYALLKDSIRALQPLLDEIPTDLSLAEATDAQLQLLRPLFSVLDGKGIPGARGTVLSKVLHRKRPQFIPLYDPQVGHMYGQAGTPPLPHVKGRSWGDFSVLYAAALRRDLAADPTFWHDIGALGADGPVTPLRALDIVAWSVSPYQRGTSSAPAEDEDE